MDKVFIVWLQIFSDKKYLSKSKNARIVYFAVKHFVIYFQHIQFFWFYDRQVSQFSSYKVLWETLSLASFDVIAARYGFLRNYILFITSFLSASLVLIVIAMILEYFKRTLPKKFFVMLRFMLILNCDFFFIPGVLALQLAIKYSKQRAGFITEYATQIPASEISFGENSNAGFVLILMLLLFFTVLYETSTLEMRHNSEDSIHDNRIFSLVDSVKKLIDFLTTTLYLNFGRENYELYLMILLISHCFTCLYFFYSIPYYCYFLNYLKVLSSSSLALVSVFFLVGYKMDNSSVTLLLFLSSSLMLIPITKAALDKRYKLIENPKKTIYRTFEHFEKSIREFLRSGTMTERLLMKMNKNNKINESVINKLCQAYYCHDILGNCALGLNKVFQVKESGFNLLLNYQIFKCKHLMLTTCEQISQSFKLFKYFLEFAKIKKGDKHFCEQYYKMIQKLTENKPDIRVLKHLIVGAVDKLYELEKEYTSLLLRFPNSAEIKQSYGSFMLNILNDNQRGNKLVRKSNTSKQARSNTRNLLKFIIDRCFLVISGDYENLGKILFYNQNFLNLLGYTGETIKSVSLNQLIPKHYTRNHDSYVINFLENSISNVVFKNSVLSLVDSEGFLCECLINCECIGFNDSANFILAIDPLNFRRREMALISNEGYIYGHSKGFCNILGCSLRFFESRFIQELVEEFDISKMKPNKVRYFPILNTNDRFCLHRDVAFVLKITRIRKTSVYMLYISDDKNEIRSWENELEFYDADELNNYGNKIETVITEGFEEYKESVPKKKVKIFDQDDDEDVEQKNLIKKQLVNNNPSLLQSTHFLTEQDLKAISKSQLMLKVTKWITIISVNSIQVFSIIISNLGILIYLSKTFSSSNSLTHFSAAGELNYLCVKSSVILRSLDISKVLNTEIQYYASDLELILERLDSLKATIFNEKTKFGSCSNLNSVIDKSFNYLQAGQVQDLKKATLIEFIELFRVEDFMNSYNSTNYEKSLKFVVINSQENILNQVDDIIFGLKHCEKEKINKLESFDIALLLVGIGILGSIFIVTAGFLMSIDKDLNTIWKLLFERLQFSVYGVRQKIFERLSQYHDKAEYLDSDVDHTKYQLNNKVKFKHSLRYLAYVSILFIVAGVIYIVNSFVFDSIICKLLLLKPEIVTDLWLKQLNVQKLAFHTQESTVASTPASYSYIYKTENNLESPHEAVLHFSSLLHSSFLMYHNDYLPVLITDSSLSKLTSSIPSANNFLINGLFTGIEHIIHESSFLAFTSQGSLSTYGHKLNALSTEFLSILEEITSNSHSSVKTYIEYLVIFTVSSCFTLVLLYIFISRPLLKIEAEVVKGITKLLTIIPNN